MSDPEIVKLGRLRGAFGLRGEVVCEPTLRGERAFTPGANVEIVVGAERRTLECRGSRRKGDGLLVRFVGFETPESTRSLHNADVFGRAAEIRLRPGEYLDADLIGAMLVDRTGKTLANVVDVVHYPAADYLVVGSSATLVPMVKAFIIDIDVLAKTIVVELPPGLLD